MNGSMLASVTPLFIRQRVGEFSLEHITVSCRFLSFFLLCHIESFVLCAAALLIPLVLRTALRFCLVGKAQEGSQYGNSEQSPSHYPYQVEHTVTESLSSRQTFNTKCHRQPSSPSCPMTPPRTSSPTYPSSSMLPSSTAGATPASMEPPIRHTHTSRWI